MKRFILLCIMIALIAGLFTACSNSGKLIGKWYNDRQEIEFFKDKTFIADHVGKSDWSGNYTVEDGRIKLSRVDKAFVYSYTLKDNVLTLKDEDSDDVYTLYKYSLKANGKPTNPCPEKYVYNYFADNNSGTVSSVAMSHFGKNQDGTEWVTEYSVELTDGNTAKLNLVTFHYVPSAKIWMEKPALSELGSGPSPSYYEGTWTGRDSWGYNHSVEISKVDLIADTVTLSVDGNTAVELELEYDSFACSDHVYFRDSDPNISGIYIEFGHHLLFDADEDLCMNIWLAQNRGNSHFVLTKVS